jgi:hypothetical protein
MTPLLLPPHTSAVLMHPPLQHWPLMPLQARPSVPQ